MRFLLAVLACFVLTGCPRPKAPANAAQPQASATPTARATATPKANTEAVMTPPTDYGGSWTTVDSEGQVFDIVIFPNGQAVTNWTKGKDGAQGERGYWRKEGVNLIAVYDDGWTNTISGSPTGLKHEGFAPGAPLDGPASNSAPITPVEKPKGDFVGVWRLNKEPDGSYQYVALQSNGRAFSTVNGGTEGEWAVKGKAAECKWPDGWIDLIEPTDEGWQKRSFVNAADNEQADVSPALRVGESRFMAITP